MVIEDPTIAIELEDLYKNIISRSIDEMKHPYKLCIDDWIKCNVLADKWCKEKGRPLLSDGSVELPNFIWGGVAVISE